MTRRGMYAEEWGKERKGTLGIGSQEASLQVSMPRETLEQYLNPAGQQEPNTAVSDESKDSQEASGQLRIKTQVGGLPGSSDSGCCFGGSSEAVGAHTSHGTHRRGSQDPGKHRRMQKARACLRDQISHCSWS